MLEVNDFNAVRISLASPEQIRSWSYGEVTKPETVNYRTMKPEKDGLFCEKIFGPTKDFECFCGKYKRIRYKGIICDKCGVEVARSKVRRERMAHIELAAPVSHVWFVKVTPSRLGLLLDISPRSLERVLYFAQYIVTQVNEEARAQAVQDIHLDALREMERIEQSINQRIEAIKQGLTEALDKPGEEGEAGHYRMDELRQRAAEEIDQQDRTLAEARVHIQREAETKVKELEALRPTDLLNESQYHELKERWGNVFQAGMGAEAIRKLVSSIDVNSLWNEMRREIFSSSGQRRKKAAKRLRVVDSLRKSGNRPEWMLLTVLPVLPPDLRPMVQLDGGRFATSDLNDLYRRVINRNNRLKRLLALEAPEIIVRNEKRMLQEAVDSLIDNGRRGRAVAGSSKHTLKSLSDMLKGKQGRFRQNLLGKRVDYSGRSVIVVGPELKLHQCGLPKRMALELFKPFVMRRLVERGYAHNIKSAKRIVERVKAEVWDVLEEVIADRPVLLNRAPTLHRLGIQAFQPILIEGSAIQIHPLVCAAFNADFDGDQMAVHVPLSEEAVKEAKYVMMSVHNMLSPSSGEPTIAPTLDMVLGCYYLTITRPGAEGERKCFANLDEARLAYDLGHLDLQAEIEVRVPPSNGRAERLKTSVGRIIFNEVLPPELRFCNRVMDRKELRQIVADCMRLFGTEKTALIVDDIKRLGFHYATKSGITIAIGDINVPEEKASILEEADQRIAEIEGQFRRGLITEDERYNGAVETWSEATDRLSDAIQGALDRFGSLHMMSTSGAKGNIAQIRQMGAMRGLMTDPSGRIIDLPIRSSFREGLTVLEYFISTHGARKGLADTALRTADSGYLTRRLIDVAQDVIVLEEDCGTTGGITLSDTPESNLLESFSERIVGRMATGHIVHPETGEVIVHRNEEIDEEKARAIAEAHITQVQVRSPLSCQARRGVCQRCYGRDLARGHIVSKGEAVGIIAAQSIGEPGTQLTMRTFHTGGVAGLDITSGLPRVEELFEARVPKGQAMVSEIDGAVEITRSDDLRKIIRVVSAELYRDEYPVPAQWKVLVAEGDQVDVGQAVANAPTSPAAFSEGSEALLSEPQIIQARMAGRVALENDNVILYYEAKEEREYITPATARILIENGARVRAGEQLTEGSINPQDILRIQGPEAVQLYLVQEVQKVYRSQGVSINDKHIEVIVRQMLRKVRVSSPGDTELLPSELVDRFTYQDMIARVLAEGGEPATAEPVLLGVTKASLNSSSFLAAASFQETTRVLTQAALEGSTDRLLGLKENVIIGKLIPARSDIVKKLEEKEKTSTLALDSAAM